ncbi:MAG: T9SS type A sorting domain-containing protein [Saprospiraceae bacterium]|nr:T9SS type A sorting domain-containing protein [Saprospiraceae bacterium]
MIRIQAILGMFILFATIVYGQNTFMTTIDMDNDADTGIQIKRLEDGYLIVVGSRCINNSVNCFGFLRVDFDGNVLNKKQYHAFPYNWEPRSRAGMAYIGNRHFMSGGIIIPGNDRQVFLMEFDPMSGDSLSFLIQGPPGPDFTGGLTVASDGNLIMYNSRSFSSEKVWLQKWTPDMELLWERFLGPDFTHQGVRSMIELSGGDLLLPRVSCDNTAGICDEHDLTLTRTDSIGNPLWTRTHSESIWGAHTIVVEADEELIVATWARDLWYELDSLIPFPPSVLWFDGEGELVNRYDFPADIFREIFNIRRAANGDLIGMGYIDQRAQELGYCGWIFRMSAQGEMRWQRYIADIRSPMKSSIFYDVVEEPDGMLVFTGLYQDTFPNHTPAVNNPNVWLVKLDSMGCLEPGCGEVQIVTSTRELVSPSVEKPALIASPNPAHDFFHLSLAGFAHPIFPLRVRLWDMQGRLVQSTEAQEYPVSIQSRQLPPGMYLAQVQTAAGQTGVVKVVLK